MTGQTATGGAVRERRRAILRGSRTGWAPIVVVAAASAAGLLLAVGPASGQTITSKRAQAEAIMAQVDSLNGNLEQTIEAYDYANVQLAEIDTRSRIKREASGRRKEEPRRLAAAHRRATS